MSQIGIPVYEMNHTEEVFFSGHLFICWVNFFYLEVDSQFPLSPNAPINVKLQGGGGQADPGEFDILMAARVKFPTPRHLLNVNSPPLG